MNFERLVLGWTDADFRNKIFVEKLVARSIRFTFFCILLHLSNCKISAKSAKRFGIVNIQMQTFAFSKVRGFRRF